MQPDTGEVFAAMVEVNPLAPERRLTFEVLVRHEVGFGKLA